MSSKNYIYVNPLGEIQDISYNNVDVLKSNVKTRNAQEEDSNIKNKSNYLQLTVWSITAAILLLIVLTFIRNINN